MGATPTLHLYIDDTGTRSLDYEQQIARHDGMDHFAFAGYLIDSEDTAIIDSQHSELCTDLSIDYPLHSTAIRCRNKNFHWLSKDKNRAGIFYKRLEDFILQSPVIGVGCVINREGYAKRYYEKYGTKKWKLCKSAYSILIERCAKYAFYNGKKLAVYIESSGKREDNLIKEYHREIYENGMPFDKGVSAKYKPMTAEEFKITLLKNPKFLKKDNPRIQLADLLAYPIAKGQFESNYKPYQDLIVREMLIDQMVEDCEVVGIKRYCFD